MQVLLFKNMLIVVKISYEFSILIAKLYTFIHTYSFIQSLNIENLGHSMQKNIKLDTNRTTYRVNYQSKTYIYSIFGTTIHLNDNLKKVYRALVIINVL